MSVIIYGMIFVVKNVVILPQYLTRVFMKKNEQTSSKVASIASKLLRDPKTPKNVKTVAASALTQAPNRSKTKKK